MAREAQQQGKFDADSDQRHQRHGNPHVDEQGQQRHRHQPQPKPADRLGEHGKKENAGDKQQRHDEQAIDVKNNSSWERVAYVDSLAQTLAGEIGQPRLPVFSRGSGRRRVALLVINQIERPRNRLIPIFRANPDMKGRTANLTNVNINGRMEGVERIIVT